MIICHVPIKLFKGQLTLVHFFHLKFRYSEKATKFEEIFHLTYDVTEYKWKIFFKFLPFSEFPLNKLDKNCQIFVVLHLNFVPLPMKYFFMRLTDLYLKISATAL